MSVHLIIDPCFVDGHSERLERSLSKVPEKADRLRCKTMERDRQRHWVASFAPARRRIDKLAQRRQLHAISSRIVVGVRRHHAAPVQGKEKLFDCGPNDRNTADAVAAAAGYDKYLFAAAHLLLAKPSIGMANGVSGTRKILPKIQRALRTKSQFVGCAHESLRGDFKLFVGEIA